MNKKIVSMVLIVALLGIFAGGCIDNSPKSDSGVGKAKVAVTTGTDGLTVEQRNVKDRVDLENRPGLVMYLYVISTMTGQVMFSDVVKGKVTSSGKRLTPRTISQTGNGFYLEIGGKGYYTQEVLEDDGTYGDSMSYLYYWDTKGIYHQLYITGGEIVSISDQPIDFKTTTLVVGK